MKQYDIRGKMVSITADKKAVTLDHEEIPRVMMAMRMQFGVESPEVLDSLKPGDAVGGRLKKESGKYVTRLEKR